ncbi:MAG: alpha-ketoglutarate-dependent dioxygenase AlkB [Planctomycetaceae bacterium]
MNQQRLFSFGPAESSGRQENYSGVPGLTFWPGFLSENEQYNLLREIDSREWQTDLRRRVQHYGYKYDYKARKIDPSMYVGPLPPFAVEVGHRLFEQCLTAELPDQVIINEYLPGQGITPHIDCEPCFKDFIATISLGSECTMDLTNIESSETQHVRLPVGSCLVFSGDARFIWKHGIKARKTDKGIRRGRRVSMTFRTVIKSVE